MIKIQQITDGNKNVFYVKYKTIIKNVKVILNSDVSVKVRKVIKAKILNREIMSCWKLTCPVLFL